MSHADVQAWLDVYVEAWHSYDPETIGDLFADDATYAYHPYDEGDEIVKGREAIVANWLEEPDEPRTWEARSAPSWWTGTGPSPRGRSATPTATFSGTCGRCDSTRTGAAPNSSSGTWSDPRGNWFAAPP